MNEKISLLAKIKALADRGEAGERDSAAVILARLMDKYGIREADLDDLAETRIYFKFRTKEEGRIVLQTLVSMIDKDIWSPKDARRHELSVDLTPAECISISYAVDFYLDHYRRELKLFTAAFIGRNNLYPKFDKHKAVSTDVSKRYTPEEMRTIENVASGLDRHTLHKAIEGGKE